jgi:hypothetical protein
MKLSRTLQIAVVAVVCTAAAGQSALAGGQQRTTPASARTAPVFRMVGEPKNEPPFTNPVTGTRQATAAVAASTKAAGTFTMVGEPRNVPPFSVAITRAQRSSLARTAPDALARYLGRA